MPTKTPRLPEAIGDGIARQIALFSSRIEAGLDEAPRADDWWSYIAHQIERAVLAEARGDVAELTGRYLKIAAIAVMAIERLEDAQPRGEA